MARKLPNSIILTLKSWQPVGIQEIYVNSFEQRSQYIYMAHCMAHSLEVQVYIVAKD